MSHEPTIEIRLNNIIACLDAAIPLLNEINDAFGTPFVQAITNTTLSLITRVQKVKRNKEDCVRLMENIHELLYAIIKLHIKSETGGSLPPTTLDHIGKFTNTLHKIHMFVEAQQDGNKFKHFLRQHGISSLLKDCHEGLQQTLDVFKMDTIVFNDIIEMKKTAENTHKELLEMISSLSDGTLSDRSSSVQASHANRIILISELFSSKSFSMLPSKPKIFHGRESELQDIINILHEESSRIAILGAGGMGKTSLARAALHHPSIVTKYQHRVFIACDSVHNSVGIAALLGAHLGLPPGKDLTKPVLHYLSSTPSSLLIIDNLETAWEPKESRSGVEEFLSMLADLQDLALLITMRGAQRPAKPLKPLQNDAAWQTFVDIADDVHPSEDITQVLKLTDNMPLAVDLIAHLVDSEGCLNVLRRWEAEKTSLLSAGQDKRSSLDASIALSISSSRMNFVPGAKHLLSLLSILPDGLSDVELLQSKPPIQDLLGSKATLLGTSLAYLDDNKRLKSLVPIREHVLQLHPPSAYLIEPLQKHFHLLLDLYPRYFGQMPVASKINQITFNLGNLHQILRRGLLPDSPHLSHAIECTIKLNSFTRLTAHGWVDLMDIIPSLLPQLCDPRLEAKFIIEILQSFTLHTISTPELLINQGISHFHQFNDLSVECNFYLAAGGYYYLSNTDPSAAMPFLRKALTLAKDSGKIHKQCYALCAIAEVKLALGDCLASRADAWEAQQLAQLSANRYQESTALRIQAKCCTRLGDYRKSITLLNRGRELLELCGLSGGLLDFIIMASEAQNHLLKSEYGQARRIHIHNLQNTEENPYMHATILLNIAEVDVMIGASDHDVLQNLNKAKAIYKAREISVEIIYCEAVLADLHLRDGNTWKVTGFDWSSRWTVVYLANASTTRAKLDFYKALQFLGDVFLCTGDAETAHNLFILALEAFTYMDVHHSRANCMIRLGDLAQQQGQLDEAVELWQTARPLFELSLQMKDVAQVDARLSAADGANQKALAQLAMLNVATGSFETLLAVEETDAEEEGKPIQEETKKDVSLMTV
ncbi:hypothetical protein FB451DRAFT_1178233 [Mycena latifolia]|nr:hypothetical protein FB451DRAFT_1178233 [Mycena latifolia]